MTHRVHQLPVHTSSMLSHFRIHLLHYFTKTNQLTNLHGFRMCEETNEVTGKSFKLHIAPEVRIKHGFLAL